MGEDLRRSRVFQVLEQLMEPEPRTLQQVLAASRPLSGEEFEQVSAHEHGGMPSCTVALQDAVNADSFFVIHGFQVAEERALAGICGSPMCEDQLARAAGGRLRRKLYQSTYCR